MFCTAVSRSLHKELAALPTSEWNVSYSESSTIAKLGEGKKNYSSNLEQFRFLKDFFSKLSRLQGGYSQLVLRLGLKHTLHARIVNLW
jgi:hypothetical protein